MNPKQGPGTHESIISSQSPVLRSGTLLVIGFVVFLLVGWFFYQETIPPSWLYQFSEAVALRASPDPSPREPEDFRQTSPRTEVNNPYICVGDVLNLAWDRLFIITPEQDLRVHPVLSQSNWPDQPLDYYVDLLARDYRYQLIVLLGGNNVVDAQLYFTFWGDLSSLARLEGFSRSEAVFTAASLKGLYIVSPALDVPSGTCPQLNNPQS